MDCSAIDEKQNPLVRGKLANGVLRQRVRRLSQIVINNLPTRISQQRINPPPSREPFGFVRIGHRVTRGDAPYYTIQAGTVQLVGESCYPAIQSSESDHDSDFTGGIPDTTLGMPETQNSGWHSQRGMCLRRASP